MQLQPQYQAVSAIKSLSSVIISFNEFGITFSETAVEHSWKKSINEVPGDVCFVKPLSIVRKRLTCLKGI